ncbi:mitochondrial ribosomal protein L18 [Phyllostomus discolor]|uniref:Mitochondrial ribosomal protein L18 n=1 Tax=Phyllostomus discolor TaxID=89673 RepID=A0A834AMG3_9CHIR|nr:mitochondrial ribosomal protein L18 [Phyllostomus discolor]
MALRSRFWEVLSVCRNPGRGVAALSTSSKPEVKPEADPLGNEAVAPEFTNRNPRNLELLAVARKERGWRTVWPSREFWHRYLTLLGTDRQSHARSSSLGPGPGTAADSLLRKLRCGGWRRASGGRGADTRQVGVRKQKEGGGGMGGWVPTKAPLKARKKPSFLPRGALPAADTVAWV